MLFAAVGFGAKTSGSTTTAAANPSTGHWDIVSSPNSRPTPTDNFPMAVTCLSESDCWAVGYYDNVSAYQTVIQHWDGSSWTVVPSPNTSTIQHNLLRSVSCSSASDCYAVGSYYNDSYYQTLIQHWDGALWVIVNSPNTSPTQYNYLLGVTCAAASQCWATGYYSNDDGTPQTLIERWNGNAWTIVSSPNTNTAQENILYSVACTSTSACWAVGSAIDAITGLSQTLIEQWNGSSWAIVTSANTLIPQNNYLYGVTCTSGSNCWATGYYNNGLADQTLMEQWDGDSWALVASPNTLLTETNRLSSVACASAAECWAAGYSNNGSSDQALIQRWDGNTWAIATSASPESAQSTILKSAACGSGAACWVIGSYSNGTVQQSLMQKWDGIAWAVVDVPNINAARNNTLLGNTCTSANDCWSIGSYYTGSVQQTLIEHWNGNSWNIIPSPNSSSTQNNILYDVACTSPSNCWIVGYHDNGAAFQTLIQHWNGTLWSIVDSPSTDSAQNNFLSDITCSSASDCWAVGYYDNGSAYQTLIEHWNGDTWMIVPSPNTSNGLQNRLHAVTCNSAEDCWTVGRYFTGLTLQTLIEHWDGSSWTIVPSPNESGSAENILWGVTCTSTSDCWGVGSHGGGGDGTGQPLIEHWDGNVWNIVAAEHPTDAQYNYNFLRTVSCSSSSNCLAGGYEFVDGHNQTLVERWNGASWQIAPSANTSATQNNFLFGLTCLSAFDCWATGYHYDDSGVIETLVEHFTAPLPHLEIRSIALTGDGHILIAGQAEPLTVVQIERATDLSTSFSNPQSVMSDAAGIFQFEDSNPATGKFYRAVYP